MNPVKAWRPARPQVFDRNAYKRDAVTRGKLPGQIEQPRQGMHVLMTVQV